MRKSDASIKLYDIIQDLSDCGRDILSYKDCNKILDALAKQGIMRPPVILNREVPIYPSDDIYFGWEEE
jgi:hypothetical protein